MCILYIAIDTPLLNIFTWFYYIYICCSVLVYSYIFIFCAYSICIYIYIYVQNYSHPHMMEKWIPTNLMLISCSIYLGMTLYTLNHGGLGRFMAGWMLWLQLWIKPPTVKSIAILIWTPFSKTWTNWIAVYA